MKKTILSVFAVLCVGALVIAATHQSPTTQSKPHHYAVVHTDAEWKKLLSPEAFNILRQAGTENAYTGSLWDNHLAGTYSCAGCGLELFSSKTKFESHTGWPSFWQPLKKEAVVEQADHTFGMDRTEVLCSRCGGHLGHVFNDGPQPTGLRYCMNSAALVFKKAK